MVFINLKKRKFDILKTFDIFHSEVLSIIKENLIKFVHVETDNFFLAGSAIKAELLKNKDFQVSVINNKNIYNLLTQAWLKQNKVTHNKKIEYENNKR